MTHILVKSRQGLRSRGLLINTNFISTVEPHSLNNEVAVVTMNNGKFYHVEGTFEGFLKMLPDIKETL